MNDQPKPKDFEYDPDDEVFRLKPEDSPETIILTKESVSRLHRLLLEFDS